jgi:sortase A
VVILGRAITLLGAALLALAVLLYIDGMLASRAAIAAFDEVTASAASDAGALHLTREPDQSSWSASAKKDYRAALGYDRKPSAVLTIERLGLEVPVFPDAKSLTLNRGAGVVDGTAQPGEGGNVVISAHRDGFFRPLEKIAVGDVIELRLPNGKERYKVAEILIVDPLDVSVLDPTEEPTLTLITCYPFRYVGSAPDRFIVRAHLIGSGGTQSSGAADHQT